MISGAQYPYGSVGRVCSRCVMDESVPDIWFDELGECNYCKMHYRLVADNPNDERGRENLLQIAKEAKAAGNKGNYDVVVGVSGGTDSTYLLHLVRELELRPLAVHLDNGWNSEVSVNNLRNVLEVLDIDLYTHVIEWLEFRDILRAQLQSRLPWADGPTDLAIIAVLYQAAIKFGVKTIFVGNNFRTEGRQPDFWTHADTRQLRYVHKKYGNGKRNTYPMQSPFKLLLQASVVGVKMHRPFYHIPFNKSEAKVLISDLYGWKDYGGHHHENIFTRFIIGVWMPQKFGIDKRKVTFSAYIRSGEMDRGTAFQTLHAPAYDLKLMQEDYGYVAKKLGFSSAEMKQIWDAPNLSILDYPSYYHLYQMFKKISKSIFRHILPFRPMMSYDMKKPG
jgi:N-acetyl sugar amidotransferase